LPWCPECGGTNLSFTATIWHDNRTGEQCVGDYYDTAYCNDCGDEVKRWAFKKFDQWYLFEE
jgi:hypothetical protein